MNGLNCEDLNDPITQLGIILYRPDTFHEKFLLKMRECTPKLKDDHPVKKWFKWVGSPKPHSAQEQKTMVFLSEILNSKFNLITDVKVKNQIIDSLTSIPGESLGEELLRSYLYLMIGNISRSDNLLREIIQRSPYHNWQGHKRQTSIYHEVSASNMEQILKKMASHPSDRKSYELFNLYLRHFYNDKQMIQALENSTPDVLEDKWGLKALNRIAPDFNQYLSLSRMEENQLIAFVSKQKFSPEFQIYWLWAFFDVDQTVNDSFLAPLETTATTDKLWFYYLLGNERFADLYISKKGRGEITAARSNLRSYLKEDKLFMLSLFKLIELGDIDQSLVSETLTFLMDE